MSNEFAYKHHQREVSNGTSSISHSRGRRNFMQSAIWAATAAATPSAMAESAQHDDSKEKQFDDVNFPLIRPQPIALNINGKNYQLSLEPRTTLLDALRETIGLTGTKKGCDRGQCGACTVIIDGQRINSCLSLAVMQDGKIIETIEGLAQGEKLHPLQMAFIDCDALQCGYCTPGQICSAKAMLDELRADTVSAVTQDVRKTPISLSDDEIRERMSGNICRCGAYQNIVAAIRKVSGMPYKET